MSDLEDSRGTSDDSITGEIRRPATCLRRSLVIPPTYEEFERQVVQWMSRCVMSRTEDARGIPASREVDLVRDFSNLSELWERKLAAMIGQTTEIRVNYLRDDLRVNALVFSIASTPTIRRSARVTEEEPSIVRLPGPGRVIREGAPGIPGTESDGDDLRGIIQSLIQAAWAGVRSEVPNAASATFTYNYRTLSEGDQHVVWQGTIIGIADIYARMAELMPQTLPEILRITTPTVAPMPVIPDTYPEPGIPMRVTSLFLQGYESGYHIAIAQFRRMEEVRQFDDSRHPLPYSSTLLLFDLKIRRGNGSRLDIYHRVREILPDVSRMP